METILVNDYNQQELDKASFLEISEIYDAAVKKRISCAPDSTKEVKYPLLRSEQILGLVPICKFDFAEGARFMRNDNLSDNRRVDLLVMLSKFVKIGGAVNDHKGSSKVVYSAVSDILVEWMRSSRYDTGYRLLARACRHAQDRKGPDLYQAKGAIVEYKVVWMAGSLEFMDRRCF